MFSQVQDLNRITYTGQQYDREINQYYLRARYYNPVIDRFTQEDVYRGDGLNLYSYCNNNPVEYCDPSGYAKKICKDGGPKENNHGSEGVSKVERLIPGTPGVVTGGDSTKLGKNIMESMGLKRSTKWTGHQAQHIIPAEMADNPIIKKIGMNLDDATNGILLRTPDAELSAMSRHRGYHSVYNDVVRNYRIAFYMRLNSCNIFKINKGQTLFI